MLEIEIFGNKLSIEGTKAGLASLSQEEVRQYEHRGFSGEADVFGLLGAILPTALPALFNLLKSMLVNDRDLKVSIEGNEFVVRDVPELETLLDTLSARGIDIQKGHA